MKEGFSFCDVDIYNIGLHYAPDLENTFVYGPTEAAIHEETFEGHTGGYNYGITKQPKTFTLRCYFEDSKIDRTLLANVYSLFKVGRSGRLVFQRRPWCYYYATVTENPEISLFNYEQGLITIRMKAYYPFARSDSLFCERTQQNYDKLMECTAFFDEEQKVPSMDALAQLNVSSLTTAGTIILGNPGSEYAAVGIEIAGNAPNGVTITNSATGQICKFAPFTNAVTTNAGKYIYLDGLNGKTSLIGQSSTEPGFRYHDSGHIDLEPAHTAIRNCYISYGNEPTVNIVNTVVAENASQSRKDQAQFLFRNLQNKYIYTDSWKKITGQADEHTLIVSGNSNLVGSRRTTIMPMNEITISGQNMNLTRCKFIYKATFE